MNLTTDLINGQCLMNEQEAETEAPKQFYSLRLEEGTSRLTLQTLNSHSALRLPKECYLDVEVRPVSYKNELLTIGVTIGNEKDEVYKEEGNVDPKEEKLYLYIRPDEILISCSTDTNSDYLSRHAYFGLYELLYLDGFYDFKKYYWPDFFDPETGDSKYLDIVTDNFGIRIKLKSGYNSFYKPGQELFYPTEEIKTKPKFTPDSAFPASEPGSSISGSGSDINCKNPCAVGYCIADTNLRALHTNHFPFLIPYSGIQINYREGVKQGINTKYKDEIKQYIGFVKDLKSMPGLDYSPAQHQLNALCFKMTELALIKHPEYGVTEMERNETTFENANRMEQLFELWQEAVPLLQNQPFKHYYFSYGMKNVIGKPVKKNMHSCTFSSHSPELCFLWTDKGDCYELEMRFKVGNEMLIPYENNTAFFLNTKDDPLKFYLLSSPSDYRLTSFFATHKFKLSVLKVHYPGHFEDYIGRLAEFYHVDINTHKH